MNHFIGLITFVALFLMALPEKAKRKKKKTLFVRIKELFKIRTKKTLDDMEHELGIVGEDGSDPELENFRVKRVQQKQRENLG